MATINKSSKTGFWIGYTGGVLVAVGISLFAPKLHGWANFLYSPCVGWICGAITARYSPRFWKRIK